MAELRGGREVKHMMQKLNNRLRREDAGFTLIELMVVVLIIAILIAIAIPTFLGARERAQDRAAQSNLRNAVTAAKAVFTDFEDYFDAVDGGTTPTTELIDSEPSLTFVASTTDSGDAGEISVSAADTDTSGKADRFMAAAIAGSGKCWYVQEVSSGTDIPGTSWAVEEDPAGDCDAAGAPAVGATGAGGWADEPGNAEDG